MGSLKLSEKAGRMVVFMEQENNIELLRSYLPFPAAKKQLDISQVGFRQGGLYGLSSLRCPENLS